MFCESWRTKLSEAAVSGEALPREAGAHLAECTGCRAAFAHEEQLSALIDGGLRSVANAPPPSSLLPRVRGAIAQPPAPATWRVSIWAFAGAGLLLFVGIAYEWTRAPHPAPLPQPIAAVVPPAAVPPKASSQPSTPFVATPARHAASLRIAPVRTAPREPEILVSGEEQANLLLYLNRLRARNVSNKAAPLIIAGDAQIKTLEIASMEFPQLSIKPLESDDSR
jgi:hypothetical protein